MKNNYRLIITKHEVKERLKVGLFLSVLDIEIVRGIHELEVNCSVQSGAVRNFHKIDGILLEMFYKVRHFSKNLTKNLIIIINYTIIWIKNLLAFVWKNQMSFLTLLKHS